MTPHADIKEYDGHTVRFEDGSSDQFDLIVHATVTCLHCKSLFLTLSILLSCVYARVSCFFLFFFVFVGISRFYSFALFGCSDVVEASDQRSNVPGFD